MPKKISQHVLTIGPDYKKHRGGIGAVIEIYSKYFEDFKFLATYKLGSKISNVFFFTGFIFKYISKLFTDDNIKLVHIHGASYGSFYRKLVCFIIAKFFFQKKIIYHVHGAEFQLFYTKGNFFTKKMLAFFINRTDELICLSAKWQTFFESNFRIKRISIVPNIIDYPSNNNKISDSTDITFLFLGLIGDRKGIFDLLQVLSTNRDYYRNKIKLLIGGNGEVEKLQNIIVQNNLEAFVKYLGWVSEDKKTSYLQKCDVYILPSYNEGLPISILEAMSYGKPIVSTTVGGIPDIVIPNRNGILIEPGHLMHLENAVNFCIENEVVMKEYGSESKLIAKKHLPETVMKVLQTIYCDFLFENKKG